MKKKFIFLVTVFFVLGIAYYFHSNYLDRKGKERFQKFNQSKISGKVNGLRRGGGQVFLTVGYDSLEFGFFPISTKNQIFSHTAEKGDSVFKASYADTLYLFKGDKTYKYTFQKIE